MPSWRVDGGGHHQRFENAQNLSVKLEGEAVEGTYRILRSVLPFGLGFGQPETGPLSSSLTIEQGWFDTSFRLELSPSQDVTAVVE